MTAFAGRFNTESPGQVSQALDGCSRGLDFADALHLAACMADEGMFTFDAWPACWARMLSDSLRRDDRWRSGVVSFAQ